MNYNSKNQQSSIKQNYTNINLNPSNNSNQLKPSQPIKPLRFCNQYLLEYAIIFVTALLLTLSFIEVNTRLNFDVDEAENLHSAWMVSQGKTPFIDFFQQHQPTLWYTLAPLYWILPKNSVLPTLAMSSLLVGLIYTSICLLFGLVVGWQKKTWQLETAALGMMMFMRTWLIHDTLLTLRIEGLMMIFFMLSLFTLHKKRYVLTGINLGLAFAFTVKSLPVLAGFGVYYLLILYWVKKEDKTKVLKQAGNIVLGFLLIFSLFILLLTITSGFQSYWFYMFRFYRLFEFSEPSLISTLKMSWKNDLWFWIVGSILWLYYLITGIKRKKADLSLLIVLITGFSLVIVLFISKYVFPRYFLPIVIGYSYLIVRSLEQWERCAPKKYFITLLILIGLSFPSVFFTALRVSQNLNLRFYGNKDQSNFYLREYIVKQLGSQDRFFGYLDYHPIIRDDVDFYTIQPMAVPSLKKAGFLDQSYERTNSVKQFKPKYLSLTPDQEVVLSEILKQSYEPDRYKGFYKRKK